MTTSRRLSDHAISPSLSRMTTFEVLPSLFVIWSVCASPRAWSGDDRLLGLCVVGGEWSIVGVLFELVAPPLSLEFTWSSDCDVCSGTVLRWCRLRCTWPVGVSITYDLGVSANSTTLPSTGWSSDVIQTWVVIGKDEWSWTLCLLL